MQNFFDFVSSPFLNQEQNFQPMDPGQNLNFPRSSYPEPLRRVSSWDAHLLWAYGIWENATSTYSETWKRSSAFGEHVGFSKCWCWFHVFCSSALADMNCWCCPWEERAWPNEMRATCDMGQQKSNFQKQKQYTWPQHWVGYSIHPKSNFVIRGSRSLGSRSSITWTTQGLKS